MFIKYSDIFDHIQGLFHINIIIVPHFTIYDALKDSFIQEQLNVLDK